MATPNNESHGTHHQSSEPKDLMALLEAAGFRGQALATAYAIALAESGGRAGAFNGNANTGDKSYGLFQINMLGGMGPARLKEYGLASNSDLFDPLTNARVAFKMSGGGKNWQPWSTYKSGAYTKFLGQSGAQVKPAPYGATLYNDTQAASDPYKPNAEAFPLSTAILNKYPELQKVYADWVASGRSYDPTDAIVATTWYQSLTPVQKQEALASTSPGEMAAFNANQAGQKVSAADSLRQYAAQMGVKYNDGWFLQQAANIAGGTGTIEQAQEAIKNMAISSFPTLADQITAGQTVASIASPYVNTMASLLEIPSGKIDLFDPMIRKALTSVDPESNKPTLQPLWGFEQSVKKDPRWMGTSNAQDSLFGAAHTVLQDWGMLS